MIYVKTWGVFLSGLPRIQSGVAHTPLPRRSRSVGARTSMPVVVGLTKENYKTERNCIRFGMAFMDTLCVMSRGVKGGYSVRPWASKTL